MVVPPTERKTAFPGWILRGLLRLFLWVLVASAVSIGIALLVGHFRGTDPSRSVPLGLYIGGAALIVVTIGGFGGRSISPGYEETMRSDLNMKRMQAMRGAYVLVGLLVIGLGVLCDWLL
jgi:hypothetical protein